MRTTMAEQRSALSNERDRKQPTNKATKEMTVWQLRKLIGDTTPRQFLKEKG
ncbi:hypothetical protein [Brevibacillus choshinensis]|uniref:hypothetical protein n=1 Tax=Brevibacillus choshinensis TaxID=54911 RepID=UPI002E2299EB|nr:hypothetical protein [Brevibacillus choshinensis]